MQVHIRQLFRFSAVAFALVLAFAGSGLAQATNPNIGMWKGNPAKSKFAPGTATVSNSTKVEAAGAGIKATVDSASADGTTRHWVYTANYDGKDNPFA